MCNLKILFLILCVVSSLSSSCPLQALVAACGISVPAQGLNLGPLLWECRVLATGPPVSILIKSNLPGFLFMNWALGVKSKNCLSRPRSQRFLLCFSAESVIVLCLKLIFMLDVRLRLRYCYFLLTLDIQLLQHHLLTRRSFPALNFFCTFVKKELGIFAWVSLLFH